MTKALKERFDTLSDALIAIVMTILVLEIGVPKDLADLPQFFHGLGLYVLSFIIILNFWYRRLQVMTHIKTTTYPAFYMDVTAHLLLCLFPLATSILLDFEVKWVGALFYGLVNLVTSRLLNQMIRDLTFSQVDETSPEADLAKKWVSQRLRLGTLTDLVTLLVALKFPGFGLSLFLIAPFGEFYMNYKRGTYFEKCFKSGHSLEDYLTKHYRFRKK